MKKLSKSISKRSLCPIATTLEIIGDKWTLLIVRDVGLFDKHKNKDFQEAGEKIPTNILANRLKSLVENGLVEKQLYQNNPPRYGYYLTDAGKGLLPVIRSMAAWAEKHINGIKIPEFKGSPLKDDD
jgi:DNA-binding HxlR family transcriptional regulator